MTDKEADTSLITDYFPKSPKRNDAKPNDDCDDEIKETLKNIDLKNLDKVTLLSSVLITPESSPAKDCLTEEESKEKKETNSCELKKPPQKQIFPGTGDEPDTPTQKKTRRKKKNHKGKSEQQENAVNNEGQKDKVSKKKKQSQPELHNSLVTDYFPVRRSGRVCRSELKKSEQEDIKQRILDGREDGLKIVVIEGKGRGVVATRPFKRGEFVIEYAGDLIDLDQAKDREAKYGKDTEKYGCYMYYFNHKNKNYCVDATAESGKLGRLINHSRTGNCHTKLIEINDRPYLTLYTSKEIAAGDEFLYDYGDRSKASLESHPWLSL